MVLIHLNSNREWASTKELLLPDNIKGTPYGEYFSKEVQGTACIFYHSGATKTLSAGACQYAIDHWNPDLVIVLGTCGGVSDQIKKLDIILVERTAQYDIKPMSVAESIFTGLVEIDNSWIQDNLDLPLVRGFIASADQSVTSSNRHVLMEHDVLAADWETASIAKICSINKVMCLVLRGVSDVAFGIDSNAELQHNDYRTNTVLIMNKLITEYLPFILLQKNKLEVL